MYIYLVFIKALQNVGRYKLISVLSVCLCKSHHIEDDIIKGYTLLSELKVFPNYKEARLYWGKKHLKLHFYMYSKHHMNWTFNGELIFVEGTSLVHQRFNFWGWSLTISDIKLEDKGAYHCFIDTKAVVLEKVSYLDVYSKFITDYCE